MPTIEDIRAVAPALEKYAKDVVHGDLWKRPGLSARDRSIVTVAALIARDQTVEQPFYLNLALDNGVTPAELSEIITHLAFYTGWANAMDAVAAAKNVFKNRNVGADQLPPASGPQPEIAEQHVRRVLHKTGGDLPELLADPRRPLRFHRLIERKLGTGSRRKLIGSDVAALEHVLRRRNSIHGVGPAGVESKMRDDLGDLGGLDAIVER